MPKKKVMLLRTGSTFKIVCSDCRKTIAMDLPGESLELDREAERVVEAGSEIFCVPGSIVKRRGGCGQEFAGRCRQPGKQSGVGCLFRRSRTVA